MLTPLFDAVFEAVVDRAASDLVKVFEEEAARGIDGLDQVEAIVKRVFRLAVRRPQLLGLIREVTRPGSLSIDRLSAHTAPIFDRARDFLQREMNAGRMRASDPEMLMLSLYSTVVGVAISVPIGIGAARNIAPLPIYAVCRAIIALSRSFQEIIIAILFVAMFGFGPFAGFLTLSFATIGFLAKLLAEDIEDIDESQAEAVRATGAGWWQIVTYAIQPQVMPRLIGLSLYRLDINFRESAVIGIVGAGGVGATLNTAMDRYEYDSAAAILILIILIVMAAEYSSGYVRKWLQ